MSQLVDGTWTRGPLARTAADGAFDRPASTFRHWVTPDGRPGPTGEGGFAAASGRYHLYVSLACPWAHRTLIGRALCGLEDHIGVSVVHPDMLEDGWTFAQDVPGATGDTLLGLDHLRDVYLRADPRATTKVTVPVLWDRERATIVSNESEDILRMLTQAWDGVTGNRLDLYPAPLRPEIEALNAWVYDEVNNGVYKAGFARTQAAYDRAARILFDALDRLEARLADRRWLVGDRLTEADIRLFTTLARFDTAYHGHFKCNRRKLVEYPALWGFARDLWQVPGVAPTLRLDHVARHYYRSHPSLDPTGIVPVGPDLDFAEHHGRDRLGPPALAA